MGRAARQEVGNHNTCNIQGPTRPYPDRVFINSLELSREQQIWAVNGGRIARRAGRKVMIRGIYLNHVVRTRWSSPVDVDTIACPRSVRVGKAERMKPIP